MFIKPIPFLGKSSLHLFQYGMLNVELYGVIIAKKVKSAFCGYNNNLVTTCFLLQRNKLYQLTHLRIEECNLHFDNLMAYISLRPWFEV